MKKSFVSQFDIINDFVDKENPLTIGNGNFAFTCDITGLQTFYKEYLPIPLCTMSNYHWANRKASGELPFQSYAKASDGSSIRYMTDTTAKDYSVFRDDVFKFDLFKLVFQYQGKPLDIGEITNVHQKLFLYDGKIESMFNYQGDPVWVETSIPQQHNNLHIHVKTNIKGLSICLFFLVPDSSIQGGKEEDFNFTISKDFIEREQELCHYKIFYKTNMQAKGTIFEVEEDSQLCIGLEKDFCQDKHMNHYFDLAKEIDTRDIELNRRMVLSLYLMKVNTLGIYPPAETGLTCNSWYGKFHLEMHIWHHLGLIRFGLYQYVLPSMKWYLSLYDSSSARAEEQGYQGIRLPKMTDYRGIDTPSNIGCLLIWQMPHLLVMIDEILIQNEKALDIEDYLPICKGIIDFLTSFFYLKNGKYHLDSPLIPANENIEYDKDTPIFEECYAIYAFQIFKKWAKKYNIVYDLTRINEILLNYAPLPVYNDCYEAFIGCTDTYTKYNHDHPMMIGMYSFFKSSLAHPAIIKNTLQKILKKWTFEDTWGWDFPMLAMSAHHIGDKELAIKILKLPALKNSYKRNGHNPQIPKQELPIYLPGNGAFLLAITHIFED
ncbi:MAG: hypothetical protein K2N64_02495 [Anaeroplasmataceae bacterium]|nr:hypothetical protein [Anaeroplasmataceae bacterium]